MSNVYKNLENKKILIGVSGGVDSMALLFCLARKKYDVSILHINYKLRGNDNEIEKQLIFNFANSNNINVYYFEYTQENKKNFQNEAREFRYKMASEIFFKYNFDIFITAHNLNDYIETYFIKKIQNRAHNNSTILKNSTIFGMNVYRPWININKNQIVRYANKYSVEWNEDYTNKTSKYLRNRIRKKINFIMNTNPSILNIWQNRIIILQNEKKYTRNDIFLVKDIKKILLLKNIKDDIYYSLNKHYIYRKKNFYFEIIKLLKSKKNFIAIKVDKYLICKKYNNLELEKYEEKELLEIFIPKNYTKYVTYRKKKYQNKYGKAITIRTIRDNDKIKNKFGHKNIKKHLIDQKVPIWNRENMVVIAVNNSILFIEKR